MRTTPALPSWIVDFRIDGYANIFELKPDETKLFCTETLLGDWNGSVLLLAKDAAPVAVIRDRIIAGEENPWRHGRRGLDRMGWQTNERVEEIGDLLPGGKLYGSALAHLMKNDEATSGGLSGFSSGPLRQHLERVLEFVTSEMRNLRAIVCLGNEAWQLTTALFAPGTPSHWPLGTPVAATICGRDCQLFRLYHPSRPFSGGWEARQREWERVAAALSGTPLSAAAAPSAGTAAEGTASMSATAKTTETLATPSDAPGPPSIAADAPVPSVPPPTVGRNAQPSPEDWPSNGPTPRLKDISPGPAQACPQRGGLRIAFEALRRPQGATELELWNALRAGCPPHIWNTFEKIDDGYRVINDKTGWGVSTDTVTGRTFAYADPEDLRQRIAAAQDTDV